VKLAAIDIGTNSIHMVVVETDGARGFSVIDRDKTMVKLGAELFGTMRLSERAMHDGVEVLARYVKLAESRGVDEILAVATSATREAENGSEFLAAIFQRTGLMPRVISGSEEARLIFLAVSHALDLGDERALAIDIGGGSVEITVGSPHELLLSESLRLGVQRLLFREGGAERLGMRELYELQGYVQGAAAEALAQARQLGFSRVIGTSGTIRTLCEAAHLSAGGTPWRSLNAQVARRKDLKDLTRKLLEIDAAKRAKLPGIAEQRADSIHVGGVLLVQLLEMAGKDEITLCDASLREGVIWDFLERHGAGTPQHRPIADPRRRSVVELARKYDRDDPREHHIARLAVQLFDQTAELHGFGAYERELLEYAALLHAVGRQIGYERRERHSRYIVRNAALRGFTEEEIELLGLLVLYHRGPRPKSRHRRLQTLDSTGQARVAALSGLLRLAVALDRGHAQLVKRIHCVREGERLAISVDGPGDLTLELWAAGGKLKPLSLALGVRVSIERAVAPQDFAGVPSSALH
jgi:exopolyphosphatase/guanosine-5'-triphosphate,3'-diphosphate pyrophosphatase